MRRCPATQKRRAKMRNPKEKKTENKIAKGILIVIFRQLRWPATRHNKSRCGKQRNIVKIRIRFWTSIGVDCFASPIHNRTIELTNAGASPPSASLHHPKWKEEKNDRLKIELAPRVAKYYVVCAAPPCKMVSHERNIAKNVDPSIAYNPNTKKNRHHHRHCYISSELLLVHVSAFGAVGKRVKSLRFSLFKQ